MRRQNGFLGSVLAVVLVWGLVACTTADESEPGGGATAVSSADVTGTPTATPSAPSTPTPTPAAPTTPADPDGELAAALAGGDLLVASDRGVDLVQGDRAEALTSIPAGRAYADGAGGVVFQGLAPPQPDAPSAAIMWLPPDGADAVTVVPDGAADFVTLHDAAVIDGQPTAVYTEQSGDTPETAEQRLVLLPLPDGEPREVAVTGGWESGAGSVSHGGDLLALHRSAEATSWFSFLSLSGEPAGVPANPLPEDEPCTGGECPMAMTISDAGDRIAWVTGSTVNVADLESDERRTVALPDLGPDLFVEGLDLTGDRLVVSPAGVPDEGVDAGAGRVAQPAIALDLGSADGDPREVTPAGFASLVGD